MMPRTLLPLDRGADAPLGFLSPVAFLAGIEARAEQHAGCAQHHHRRQPTAVADAAGRRDRHAAGDEIDDRRDDIEGGARRAVAAGLGALRDQDVGAGIEGLPRHASS